ncbi:exo-alpha-sialidase [Deinococcus yunweiensis]|uniref:exo-alpha-sialidase n=1 Tax=Deinococcus yunweiensis TaxID=367282 RepID=UPI00398F658A
MVKGRGAGTRRAWLAGTGLAALAAATLSWRLQQQDANRVGRLGGDFHALRVLPGGRLLYGQHAGVSISTDGGRTWSAPDGAGDAMSLTTSPVSPLVMMAGHGVLKSSRDSGASWQEVGFGSLASSDLHGFTVVPGAPDVWFASIAGLGLYRTRNARTWEVMAPDTADASALAAGPGAVPRLYALVGGRLITSAGGTTWQPAGAAPSATGLEVHPVSGDVYLAGPGGLSRSTDTGATWQQLGFPGGARLVAADPEDEQRLYAVDLDGLVFRSLDAGRSWRPAAQEP